MKIKLLIFTLLISASLASAQSFSCVGGPATLDINTTSTYYFNFWLNPNATNITWSAYGGVEILYSNSYSVTVRATNCGVGLIEATFCDNNEKDKTPAPDCCNRCVFEIDVPIEGCCGVPTPDCEVGINFAQLVCQGAANGAIWLGFSDPETQEYCESQVVDMCWDWSIDVTSVSPVNLPGTPSPVLTTPGSCLPGWHSRWDFNIVPCIELAQLQVTITFTDGTTQVIDFAIPNDCPPCTGDEEVDFDMDMGNIFPNPSTGIVTLDYKGKDYSGVRVVVKDLYGREISQQNVISQDTQIKIVEKGMFFVEIWKDDKLQQTEKVIISQ